MPARMRITVYLKSGATVHAHGTDLKLRVDESSGRLAEFEVVSAESPRLAWVDVGDVSAVVVEEGTNGD